MLGIFLIFIVALYLAFLSPLLHREKDEEKDPKFESQMKKLWSIAQSSMREKKTVRAEKALLTILKFDEKNAAAYNRLGILYAKSQHFDDAIECFEIAQSLDNNASSLHNVGLIYLETGAYEKAVMAFHQALELEGDVPARFIALAKAEEKLGNRKNAIEALENAYDLDHSTTTLRQILAIYEAAGDTENITATTARIEARIAEAAKEKENAARTKRVATRRAAERNARMTSRRVTRPVAKSVTKTAVKPVTRPVRTVTRSTARPVTAAEPTTRVARPAQRPATATRKPAKTAKRKVI